MTKNFLSPLIALFFFGLLHAQNVGIGTNDPVSKLDIAGGLTVGSSYAGTNAAPTDGAIIQGKVGMGIVSPNFPLDVAGDINSSSGYRLGNSAPNGSYLRGNGNRFVAATIQAGDIPDLSGIYIKNQTSVQPGANFNISGVGTVAGTLYTPNIVTTGGNLNLSGASGGMNFSIDVDHNSNENYLFHADGKEIMRLNDAGQLAINNNLAANTGAALSITPMGGGWNEGIELNPASNNFSAIFFRETANSAANTWFFGKINNNNLGVLRNGLTGMSGTTRTDQPFEIATTGDVIFGDRVGIGSAPSHTLTVKTTSSLDGIYQTDGTRWMKSMSGTVGGGSYNPIVSANDNAIIYSGGTQGTGSLAIAPWSNSASGIKISESGAVGIGTATPYQGKLWVQGGDVWIVNLNTAMLAFNTDNTGDPTPNASIVATANGISGTSADILFNTWNGAANTEIMRVRSNGNVKINNLAGTGTRYVTADASGVLGTTTSAGGFSHYIGEQYGGGVIFYLWRDASGTEHGLIVDLTNLSTNQKWSNITTGIGANARSSWNGLGNSNAIVAQSGHTSSAASLCLNSTRGGQSDWYLPSLDELSLLWQNEFLVNKALSTISGATQLSPSAFYWSSTETDDPSDYACTFTMRFGNGSNTTKSSTFNLTRAIRAF